MNIASGSRNAFALKARGRTFVSQGMCRHMRAQDRHKTQRDKRQLVASEANHLSGVKAEIARTFERKQRSDAEYVCLLLVEVPNLFR